MPACPSCSRKISLWRTDDSFACRACGTRLHTNGVVAHMVAGASACLASLVFLIYPGHEGNAVVQVLIMLSAFMLTYRVVVKKAFRVRRQAPLSNRNLLPEEPTVFPSDPASE